MKSHKANRITFFILAAYIIFFVYGFGEICWNIVGIILYIISIAPFIYWMLYCIYDEHKYCKYINRKYYRINRLAIKSNQIHQHVLCTVCDMNNTNMPYTKCNECGISYCNCLLAQYETTKSNYCVLCIILKRRCNA